MSNVIQGVEYWELTLEEYNQLVSVLGDAYYSGELNFLSDFVLTSPDRPGYVYADPNSLSQAELSFFANDLIDEHDLEIYPGKHLFPYSQLPAHTM